VDPAGMATSLGRNSRAPLLLRFMIKYVLPYIVNIVTWLSPNGSLRSPTKSGADLLLACFDEGYLGERPKAVFLDGSKKMESTSLESKDEKKQRALWVDSLKLARVRVEETVLKNLD
jgi:hypothetical protein